jgi:kinetochore protein Mis12/MTW1
MAPSSLDTTQNLLLTEVLGVSPQILLDDYTNIAHENVRQTTEGLEVGVRDWIEREVSMEQRTACLAELESGVIALQTLIDSHSDFAFDLFEVWVWRNIFDVPANAVQHIVMPHHEGLDLSITEKQEFEACEELAMLRRKLEAVSLSSYLLTPTI